MLENKKVDSLFCISFQAHLLHLRISMSLKQLEITSLLHGSLRKGTEEVQSLATTLSSVRLEQKNGCELIPVRLRS